MTTKKTKITMDWNAELYDWHSVREAIIEGYVIVLDSNTHTLHLKFDARNSHIYGIETKGVVIKDLFKMGIDDDWKTVYIVLEDERAPVSDKIKDIISEYAVELNDYWNSQDICVLDEMFDEIRYAIKQAAHEYELVDAEYFMDSEPLDELKEEITDADDEDEREYLIDEFVDEWKMITNKKIVGQIVLGLRPLINSMMDDE